MSPSLILFVVTLGLTIVADTLGNTVSTSIPVVLVKLLDEGTLAWGSGQEVFLYGAASGLGIGHLRIRL